MNTRWLTLFVLLLASVSGRAQWAVGAGVTYCSHIDMPGINVNITWSPVARLYVGPDFSAFLNREETNGQRAVKTKELEYNINVHYAALLRPHFLAYPLAGVNISKVTTHDAAMEPEKHWYTAINLGGGLEWKMAGARFFAEMKYVTVLHKYDAALGVLMEIK